MNFKDTNFLDDLGREVGKDRPILGCLGLIIGAALVFAVPFAVIVGVMSYTKIVQKMAKTETAEFTDGKTNLVFTAPMGWFCAGEKEGPYKLNRPFLNEQKSKAALETIPYKNLKYTPKKMKTDTAGIAAQIRAVLRQRALKAAELNEYDDESEGVNPVEKVIEDYKGYKKVKSIYAAKSGYVQYKKGAKVWNYYFRPLKKSMIVMTYRYEDSEENREEALKQEEKLVQMWEAGLGK